MKKRLLILLSAGCALLLLLYGATLGLRYLRYKTPNEAYFGKETYREILHIPSCAERAAVAPILTTLEAALSYRGSEAGLAERFGALARYAKPNTQPDFASEEHVLSFLTAKLQEDTGHLWVAYRHRVMDADGRTIYGVGSKHEMILACIELVRQEDDWVVVRAREHP